MTTREANPGGAAEARSPWTGGGPRDLALPVGVGYKHGSGKANAKLGE